MQRIDALQLAINAMILRHVQLSQCRVCGAEALECEEALKVLDQTFVFPPVTARYWRLWNPSGYLATSTFMLFEEL